MRIDCTNGFLLCIVIQNTGDMINQTRSHMQIVSEIVSKISKLFPDFRVSFSYQEYVSISLFLLTLYKEKMELEHLHEFEEDKREALAQFSLTVDISHQLRQDLLNFMEKKASSFGVISKYFQPLVVKLDYWVVQDLFSLFDKIERKTLKKNFPEIFDGILYELIANQKKFKSELILPKEVSYLIANLVDLKTGETVYNPYAGLASFGAFINPKAKYIGQEIDRTTWALGALRLIAYGRKAETEFLNDDSIKNWNPKGEKYDLVISNPPFGLRKQWGAEDRPFYDIESDLIYSAIHTINETGKAVIIVPTGVLFSKSNSSIRRPIVNGDLIEKVILLPGGLLFHTNIPSAILVLNKQKSRKEKVLFINGKSFVKAKGGKQKQLDYQELLTFAKSETDDIGKKWVNSSDIQKNDFNLLPTRYLFEDLNLPTEYKMEELGELVTPVQRVLSDENLNARFARIRDLSDNPIEFEKDFKTAEFGEIPRHASVLPNETLLLAMRWNALKPTFFSGSNETVFFSYSDIFAGKINAKKVDIEYLVNELYADYVSKQIDYLRSGQFIPGVSRPDLLKIKIQVPSLEKQKEIVLQKRKEIIKVEESRLQQLKIILLSETVEEEALLRHKIRGKVNNLESSFKKFQKIFSEKIASNDPNVFELQVPGARRNLGEYLKMIDRDLKSISKEVNIAGHENDFLKVEFSRINIIDFIMAYCNEIMDRTGLCFKLLLRISDEDLIKDGAIKIFINGNENLLREAFDNLIENAEIHAFKNTFSIKNEVYLDILPNFEGMELQIDFSNTGFSVPSGFSFKAAIKQPGMAGKKNGNGVGLWYINKVMEKHGGKFSFTDEAGPEGLGDTVDVASTFELTFPIETERSDECDESDMA